MSTKKKLSLLFLLASLGQQSFAENQFLKKFENIDIDSSITLGGDHVNNNQVKARVFGITGNIAFEYPLTETLEFELDFGANLEVGSNNSFIIDEYAPRRQWRLGHAYFDWEPVEWFELALGAVDQSDYNSPILLTGAAFLAAELELSYDFTPDHKIFFKFEQAIPNNLNLAQRIGIVEDGTPLFTMSTIGLDMSGDLLSVDLQAMRWSFSNLSTGAAFQSQYLGNSVSGGSQVNSDFLYGFSGYNVSGGLKFFMSDSLGLNFMGQYLYNDKAPDNRNLGHIATAGLILGHYEPYIGSFRVESDVSPGFYNTNRTGHNNMEGNILGLHYRNPHASSDNKLASDISANIEYVDSTPINPNAFQSNTQKISFSIEMPIK
jgi:hypothetical protein